MQNGSSALVTLPLSKMSSRSSGSSTKSCRGALDKLTGDSGVVSSDEFDPGHRLCPGFEKVEGTGEEALEALDEFREWPGAK